MKSARKKRHPASIAIRTWMLQEDLRWADIVDDLKKDLKSAESYVSHYIAGRMPSSRLQAYFLGKGCPPELLADLERLCRSNQKAQKGTA